MLATSCPHDTGWRWKTLGNISFPRPRCGAFEHGSGKALFGRALRGELRRALPLLSKPYGAVVDHYFREEKLNVPLVWMAAQSGPPPSETFGAPFLLWHPLYQEGTVARPSGGSSDWWCR